MTDESLVRIPLADLSVSPRNTRRTGGKKVDDLAASIAAHGLLQNLTVEQLPHAGPEHQGGPGIGVPEIKVRYGVIAGGRRLRALQLLAGENRLPADCRDGVWCRIENDPQRITEISAAENTVREAMHPHDEFVAFRDLVAEGLGVESIAARFGVTPLVVERRLKLANVSPVLLREFRDDKMSLDQMMALTITDDHMLQERVWNEAAAYSELRNPRNLRAALTKGEIPTSDKRVRFIGLDAYEAAGGPVHRDLFTRQEEHYVTDVELLDRLVAEKLEAKAQKLRDEGWSFVKVLDPDDHTTFGGCSLSQPQKRSLDDAERAEIADLRAQIEAMPDEDDDAFSDDTYDRIEDLELRIDEIEARCESYSDRQKAKAGASLRLTHSGVLEITRGILPEGKKAEREAAKSATTADGKPAPKPEPTLSESMLRRFSARRTQALQAELIGRADVSLALLAHQLLLPLFYRGEFDDGTVVNALTVKVDRVDLDALGFDDVTKSDDKARVQQVIAELRHTCKVPDKRSLLWTWLLNQSRDTVVALLAAVPALTLDAVMRYPHEKPKAVAVADALGLDMADHWQPDAESFLQHVPRAITVEAIREVHNAAEATKAEGLKKAELVPHAAELLQRRGWLPKPLRRPGYKLRDGSEPDGDELPEFPKSEPTKAKAKPKAKPATKPKAKAARTTKTPTKAAAKSKPKAKPASKKAPAKKTRKAA